MAKKQRNEFTNHEVEIVRKYWPTKMSMTEILTMLPRHTEKSINQYARYTLKLKRPLVRRVTPARDRFKALIELKPMSQDEIAVAMDVSRRRVYQFIDEHRAEVYIKDWRWSDDHLGLSALWALGSKPDAPRPPGYRRWRDGNKQDSNPFLAAAGMVQIPSGETGRIYRLTMDVEDEAVA